MRSKSVVDDPQPGIQLGCQRHACQTGQLGNRAFINRLFSIHHMDQRTFCIIDCQHIENVAFNQRTIEFC